MKSPEQNPPKKKFRKRSRSLNPLRHGFFTCEPVIPDVESKREYRRFRSKIVKALAPQNDLLRELAIRIADIMWRLRRVGPYEAAVIARSQEAAEMAAAKAIEAARHTTPVHTLELILPTMRASLESLTQLPDLSADTIIRRHPALDMLQVVAEVAGVSFEDLNLKADGDGVEGLLRHQLVKDWTAAEILEKIAGIARETNRNPEGLRQAAILHLTRLTVLAEAEARRVIALRDSLRRLHLLPDGAELDRIVRGEAHLSRQLMSCLHEYEAWQARARGETAPLARLDVQGLD